MLLGVTYYILADRFSDSAEQSKSIEFYESNTGIPLAIPADYDNCVILEKKKAILIINQKRTELPYVHLSDSINAYINTIKEKEIKILFTRETEYPQIITLLNIMAINRIIFYKLIRA